MNKLIYLAVLTFLFVNCSTRKTHTENSMNEKVNMNEQYRPQIHFTPATGWMNDPNGMVYYNGEYHLFYQHYPHDKQWGPMHWGHAISTDLMHWEHQPIALYPDSLGYIFSGSAVVDWKNTSGLGIDGQPPLIAIFTYHNPEIEKQGGIDVESQAIAFSNDNGRTWIKYAGNPVLKNPGIRDFRDPKVFWHQDSEQWIMCLAAQQVIHFYGSKNCLEWSFLSEFGQGVGNHDGVWECPDLFPLRVHNTGETKWVLIVNINPGGPAGGSAGQYFVGDFDGKKFTSPQRNAQWVDYGKDNYAGVTWSDVPDNRRIFLGWMNNWQYAGKEPSSSWSGAGTLPRELGLVKDRSTYLLTSTPVNELENIRGESKQWESLNVTNSVNLSDSISFASSPLEIQFTLNNNNAGSNKPEKYGVRLSNKKGEYIAVGYNTAENLFYIDRTNATGNTFSDKFAGIHNMPYLPGDAEVNWHLVIDDSSVEFFAAGYRVVMTDVFYPSEPFGTVELFAQNGSIGIKNVRLTELLSIWK